MNLVANFAEKNSQKTEIWENVLENLAQKISKMEFFTWFKKIKLGKISGNSALILCPSEMNKNWIEQKYSSLILANFQKIFPEIEKIFFEVNLELSDAPAISPQIFSAKKNPRKLPNRPAVRLENGLESRIINPKYLLENFVIGDENRLAHAACSAAAEENLSTKKKYNPLFIYGGVGLGKTHLLQATANEILRRNSDALVIYSTAERILNEIIAGIRNRKMENFRKKYRRVDALILDDVQFFEGKEKTQEELFNTFNDLFESNKQIIFSADRPPSELTGISDRLRSRMGWGLSVDVQLPNFETRMAILQEKAKNLKLILPLEIQEFVAANIRKNLRELENILNQISAEIDLTKISPTIQSVGKIFRKLNPHEILENKNSAQRGLVKSPDEIISAVADYFRVPATEILGASRKAEIVFPRQIAWFLCKKILQMNFDAIGRDFGGKNHTTILHGIRKIEKLQSTDSAVARHLHALKKDLGVK